VIAKIGLRRKYCLLGIAYGSRIAGKNFNTTGRATRVAAATVKNVDTRILDRKN
jgi:hypothetical protein